MHVLYLHSYYCTNVSSSGSRSHDLCTALIARGHSVTVVCQVADLNRRMFENVPGFIKRVEIDRVTIYGINIPYYNKMGIIRRIASFFLFMIAACAKSLFIHDVDIVFATSTPPTIAVPAIIYKILKRKPFVLELRDIWPDFVEQLGVLPGVPKCFFRFIDWWMIRIYHCADALTTTTHGMTEIIANKGVDRSKLGTILLGANRSLYAKDYTHHKVLSEPVLKDKFIVGFLGSISYGYGLQRFLDVASSISQVNSNVSFLILGRGGQFQALSERIKEMCLSNIYLGSAIPYQEVPEVLKNIHVGYESSLPSSASDCALDNKFYDYISAGLPILSNYDGDMGNLLRKWNCGLVAGDIAAEVSFLDTLERNRDIYSTLSQNALNLAEKLDREKQKELFVTLLERMSEA